MEKAAPISEERNHETRFLKAAIAACFACAAVTVSAANPFTDVSADDWAYQQSLRSPMRASSTAIRTAPSAETSMSPVMRSRRSSPA